MPKIPLMLFDLVEYTFPTKAKFHNGKEYVLEDSTQAAVKQLKKPKLFMKTKATHAGVLINERVYPGVHVRDSVPYWLQDYGKPVLNEHPSLPTILQPIPREPKVVGRVGTAKFVQLVSDSEMLYDFESPKSSGSSGSGYIELGCGISDQEAIEEILDGRKVTVSIGARPSKMICSICRQDMLDAGNCEHEPGKSYTIERENDKEKSGKYLAYAITGKLEYHHLAFTWRPADTKAQVESVELIDSLNGWNYLKGGPTKETGELLGFRLVDTESGSFLDMDLDARDKNSMSENSKHSEDKVRTQPAINVRDAVLSDVIKQEGSMSAKTEDPKPVEAVKTEVQVLSAAKPETVAVDSTATIKPEPAKAPEVPAVIPAAVVVDKKETVVEDFGNSDKNPTGVETMGEVEIRDHEELVDFYMANPDVVAVDARLTTAARKKLPDSVFCGPDRSFPTPDASHVRAALQRLAQGFPKGASSDIKARIASCVRGRAKKLGVQVGGDSATDTLDPNTQSTVVRTLAAQVSRLESDCTKLKVDVSDALAQRNQYKNQADTLQEKLRVLSVDRIVDLEFSTGRKNVKNYRTPELLKAYKDDLLKRELVSLTDMANDLQKELIEKDSAGTHSSLAGKPVLEVKGLGATPPAEEPKSNDAVSYKESVLSKIKTDKK